MDYLPAAAHFLGGQLNALVVVTAALFVEGGVVLLAGLVGFVVAASAARDGAGTALFCLFAGGLLVAVDSARAHCTAREAGALFELVLLLLAVGAGALELLVHELACVVLDGLAELDFGVREAAARFVEGGSLEGGAGGQFGDRAGRGVFDDGGGSVGWLLLGLFGHGGRLGCFAHCRSVEFD